MGFNLLRPSYAYFCISKLNIIGSNNSLLPVGRQTIIWTNAGILLIVPIGTIFNEIVIEIYIFIQEYLFEIVVCKMVAILSRPQFVNMNCDHWYVKITVEHSRLWWTIAMGL